MSCYEMNDEGIQLLSQGLKTLNCLENIQVDFKG